MSSLNDGLGSRDQPMTPMVARSGDRLLRLPEVMDRVGLKRTAIYQRMREGRFPMPRSLGPRCTVWLESELEDWINSVAQSPEI